MTTSPAHDALHVVDWRRRVARLYAEVRHAAVDDPVVGHALWVTGRDELFAEHPASPLDPAARAAFAGLDVAPYDPAFRFEAEVLTAPGRRLEVPTGTDGVVPFEEVGRVALGALGTLSLWALRSYGGGLFVPCKDATAGRPGGTYGGGRYVLDTTKGADLGSTGGPGARVVVDLNFAYNPSCAYDPAWACPLAPPENTLDAPVPVGELVPHAALVAS
ncbi:DUF1684 domain-containing protein [Cellulomonas cellasea]|uniref:DUF1684 domain-containing protein n=2 Tax=Cellulomonas cellasea TaxID=43670 RepID=A0A0A0B5P9_9CELL|nr:DUF1684 domain-containing protein [Cellulomonas cellasea]KGM02180.1 hypothetical protein Q760_15070 [Cellulomonas cellasea DSM 20118]GEA88945.1 hypothetical protein CCE01nite_28940 [Cellulomonas cellasea]